MKIHPYVLTLLNKLAADAEHCSAKLDMRRAATRSLQPQSGAARIRLDAESREWTKIADDLRSLVAMAEKED